MSLAGRARADAVPLPFRTPPWAEALVVEVGGNLLPSRGSEPWGETKVAMLAIRCAHWDTFAGVPRARARQQYFRFACSGTRDLDRCTSRLIVRPIRLTSTTCSTVSAASGTTWSGRNYGELPSYIRDLDEGLLASGRARRAGQRAGGGSVEGRLSLFTARRSSHHPSNGGSRFSGERRQTDNTLQVSRVTASFTGRTSRGPLARRFCGNASVQRKRQGPVVERNLALHEAAVMSKRIEP